MRSRRRVLRLGGDGIERGGAFQHLEAVGRDQHAARRLVHAVVGAADALQQPRGALRRADIDHEIDVAPVDAEVERRGADHRAQPPDRHRLLDLAALRHVERAVMQRDREVVVVDAPELLEDRLGLAAGVDEHQRGLVLLDQAVDLGDGVARGVPGPRQALGGVEHGDVRRRAFVGDDEIGEQRARFAAAAAGSGAGRRARRPSPTGRPSSGPAPARTAAPARARADRRASTSPARAVRRARRGAASRTGTARRARRGSARAAPASSAGYAAGRGAGAGASTPACRRCGSRSGSAASSRRPAFRDCARCRRRAPSAARCRACAARPRAAPRGRWR